MVSYGFVPPFPGAFPMPPMGMQTMYEPLGKAKGKGKGGKDGIWVGDRCYQGQAEKDPRWRGSIIKIPNSEEINVILAGERATADDIAKFNDVFTDYIENGGSSK